MSSFGKRFDEALDKHITGNYGEDQFPKCINCNKPLLDDDDDEYCV